MIALDELLQRCERMPPVEASADRELPLRVLDGEAMSEPIKPYGCHNRTLKGGYYAPNRKYFPDGSFEASSKFIKFKMSMDCKFDRRTTDERCAGCKHVTAGEAG